MRQSVPIPPAAKPVLQLLQAAGYAAYVVGGAVRDTLLGRHVADVDIATDARPDEIKAVFPDALDTGIAHGTLTVSTPAGEKVEVTTFRADGPYLDGRHPAYVSFRTSILDDLARRDFTINAMAVSPDGTLLDPFAGATHLAQRQLCAVGDADARFVEDSLRILRGLRFTATYELSIEAHTMAAMQRQAEKVTRVSRERIGQELWKLANGNWVFALPALVTSGVFEPFAAPLGQLQTGFANLHRLAVARTRTDSEPLPLGLAALALWCHGLPSGPDTVDRICRTTALGKAAGRQACCICGICQRIVERLGKNISPLTLSRELYADGEFCTDAAVSAVSWLLPDKAANVRALYRIAKQRQPLWRLQDLAITGRDIQALGAQGAQIGAVRDTLIRDVLDDHIRNQHDALLCRAVEIMQTTAEGADDD